MTKPGHSQTKNTLHELAKEFPDKTYRELEKYREEDRQQAAGTCIMGEMRKDREEFELGPEEQVEALKKELDLERECSQAGYLENQKLTKEIKNLKWIKDHDYIFLVDENKKLHAENKKLHEYLEKRIDGSRKSGL